MVSINDAEEPKDVEDDDEEEEEEPRQSVWLEPCLPDWLKGNVLDEFYIKVSLVLLPIDLIYSKDTLAQALFVVR